MLAVLNSQQVQPAVLSVAVNEKTPEPVKVGLFKALADHAKFFGAQLDAGGVDTLRTALAATTAPELRAATAEAMGALNLPTEQAKLQILQPNGEKKQEQAKQ